MPQLLAWNAPFVERWTKKPRGLRVLFALLLAELAMVHPSLTGRFLRLLPESPLIAATQLWQQYVQFALPAVLIVFVAAALLHLHRRRSATPIDAWDAASLLAYAWIPHALLTALGSGLRAVGLDLAVFPHHPVWNPGQPPVTTLLKVVVAYGPSAVFAWGLVSKREPQISLKWGPRFFLEGVAALLGFGWGSAGPEVHTEESERSGAPSSMSPRVAMMSFVAILGVGLGGAGREIQLVWDEVRPLRAGDPVPHLHLVDLDGGAFSSHEIENKVALIDFWATWCGPCVRAMPELVKLHAAIDHPSFELISVNTEPGNTGAVRTFAREHILPFPVYVDSGSAQQAFQVTSLPTVVLTNRGRVAASLIGPQSARSLEKRIRALLAKQ